MARWVPTRRGLLEVRESRRAHHHNQLNECFDAQSTHLVQLVSSLMLQESYVQGTSENSARIITGARGAPWLRTDVKLRIGALGCPQHAMPIYEAA